MELKVRPGEEIWESTVAGQVWVETTDEKGKAKSVCVRGFGRLRITSIDREINQDMVVDPEYDPFTNGMLIRVDAPQDSDPRTASDQALDTAGLMAVFNTTGKAFEKKVDGLNEVNVRRMWDMRESVDATASQVNYLRKSLDARWPIGTDTPSYRELKGIGEVATSAK